MPAVCGDAIIKIIQGDSYKKTIYINGIENKYINKLYFTCTALNIQKELYYNENIEKYELYFSHEETEKIKIGVFDYDITVYFNSDCVKTIIYKNTIKILPKTNKVEDNNE